MQKFYWPSSYNHRDSATDNSQYEQWRPAPPYPPLSLPINTTHFGAPVQVNIEKNDTTQCGTSVQVNIRKNDPTQNGRTAQVNIGKRDTTQYEPPEHVNITKIDTSNNNPPVQVNIRNSGTALQANMRKNDTTYPTHTSGRHTVVRLGGGQSVTHCKVTGEELYSTPAIPPVRLRQDGKAGQRLAQKNKTWNQNTLSQAEYEYGIGVERGQGKRQSVQNFQFFKHNYENVYDDTYNIATTAEELENLSFTSRKSVNESDTKVQGSIRQTPRSRKRVRAPNVVFRSKSCDRGGVGTALLDNLSCISRSGRTSPSDSLACQNGEKDWEKDPSGPAQSLAQRLRGRLVYVNKKMNQIRSRSAERLRGCTSAVRSEVIAVDQTRTRPVQANTACVYSGPFIGQARAVVDCVPSPYDRDALPFAKDDLIDIIAMNAGGLWRGRCRDRVGNFKFVNVEILPTRSRRRSRSRSLRRIKRKPGTVAEVMKVLNMDEHLPVFVLNGYEDLTLFKDLDDEELDYLGISDETQREKLIAMAELLFPDNATEGSDNDPESNDMDSESGVADLNSDSSLNSDNSFQLKNTGRRK